MTRATSIALLLVACAHAPRAEEAEVPAVETRARVEAGENQTAPVRKACRGSGPMLPAGESIERPIEIAYLVGANGRVSDVSVTGKASAAALRAIKSFVASCTYKPATRDGKPIAVRWRGELSFTRVPVPR